MKSYLHVHLKCNVMMSIQKLAAFIIYFVVLLLLNTGFQNGINQEKISVLVQDTCDANSLRSEYQYLVAQSQFQQAIPYLLEALEIYRKHQLWEQYVANHIELSILSDNFEITTKSKYAKLALEYSRTYLNENHPLLAKAYRQQGEALMMYEKFDSANYYFKAAIPILQQHQEWENIAWCKILTAVNHYYLNNIEAGQAELEGQFWQNPHLNSEVLSSLYDLQGVYSSITGDLDKAISSTMNALNLALAKPKKSAIDSSRIASNLSNLGEFYNLKGDIQRALDYFKQASSTLKSIDSDIETLIIINNNVGKILLHQDQYEAAFAYFKQNEALINKLEESRPFIDDLEEIYYNLGVIYKEINQPDSAIYYLEKTKALPQLQHTSPDLSLGNLYMQLEQPQLALVYYEQALTKIKSLKYDIPNTLSRTYFRIGEAYAKIQSYKEALQYFQKSLVINHTSFTDSLNIYKNPGLDGRVLQKVKFLETLKSKAYNLALLSDKTSDLEASLSTYLLTIQWTDSLKKVNILEGNELYWNKQHQAIYEGAIHIAYQLYQKTNKTEYINTALRIAEKSKAALLLEAFSTNIGIENTKVPATLLEKERDLSIDIAYYEKALDKVTSKPDTAKIELYQGYIRSSRLELANLKETIEKDYPDFHQLKYGDKDLDIEKTQQLLLNDETALIEYFIGQQQAYAFVLSNENVQMLPLPPYDSIQASLEGLKKQLFQTEAFQRNPKAAFSLFNQTAFQIYQTVLASAIKTLPTTIKQLIIIPDGILNTIPFEVFNYELVDAPSNNFGKLPYLIHRYTIHYGYSIKLLIKNQERHQTLSPNIRCLAFAPSYKSNQSIALLDAPNNQVRGGISKLEYTAKEIHGIAKNFKGTFESGANATKALFKVQSSNYGILHLAMHGEADFDNPNFGHLIFTNVGVDSLEESLLYHYEIANLNLNAQLAVLSACETGIGKYEEGEGVFSLARSFMYAGVPSVVMSLWKVNDQSTSQIMPYFYMLLSARTNKSQALREAKLQYIKEADLSYRHPFYWAGFVALGEQQPLRRSALSPFALGLVSLGFLIVLGGILWYIRR